MLVIIVKYCNTRANSEPCQTSKIECFAKIGSSLQLLTVFAKHSMVDV